MVPNKNSKLKNVQGSTFFSDAILGSSGRFSAGLLKKLPDAFTLLKFPFS